MSDAAEHRVPPITLVRMSSAIYGAWVERAIREYAEGHVAAGLGGVSGAAARYWESYQP